VEVGTLKSIIMPLSTVVINHAIPGNREQSRATAEVSPGPIEGGVGGVKIWSLGVCIFAMKQ